MAEHRVAAGCQEQLPQLLGRGDNALLKGAGDALLPQKEGALLAAEGQGLPAGDVNVKGLVLHPAGQGQQPLPVQGDVPGHCIKTRSIHGGCLLCPGCSYLWTGPRK